MLRRFVSPVFAALLSTSAAAQPPSVAGGTLSVALGSATPLPGSRLLLQVEPTLSSDGVQTLQLTVSNTATETQTLDVFSFGPATSAYWRETTSPVSTRRTFIPGATADLVVKTKLGASSTSERLLLMSGWKPVRAIALEPWPTRANITRRVVSFVNSAFGEWKERYTLCAPEAPPGYRLLRATPTVEAPKNGPPRSCPDQWAECQTKPAKAGESVCFDFLLQGERVENTAPFSGYTDSVIKNIRIQMDSEFEPLPRQTTLIDLDAGLSGQ